MCAGSMLKTRGGIGARFDRLIDGREDDFVARDVHDDAASGEIGHDFVGVLAVLGRRHSRRDDANQ